MPQGVGVRRLRRTIEQRGALVDEVLTLPRTGEAWSITRPADTDLLLDHAVADPEQNLPYWSEIWPSGIALADAIETDPAILRGQRVLELGSGLGVTAIAALRAGADLTVADYSPESLDLCRYNCLRAAGQEPRAIRTNWRKPGREWEQAGEQPFAVVLAADVLYEGRDIDPLLRFLSRLVAADGVLWLAEPGRPPAARFLDAARQAGWNGPTERHRGPWPDPKDAGVEVAVHRLRPPEAGVPGRFGR